MVGDIRQIGPEVTECVFHDRAGRGIKTGIPRMIGAQRRHGCQSGQTDDGTPYPGHGRRPPHGSEIIVYMAKNKGGQARHEGAGLANGNGNSRRLNRQRVKVAFTDRVE